VREEEAKKKHLEFNEPATKIKGHGWLMNFVNSSPMMTVESYSKHKEVFNYFSGKESSNTNVSTFQEVWYKNVYDNVDVRYYPSSEGTLEYDIVCKQGFDKGNIVLQLEGIKNAYLKNSGALGIQTSVGEMILPAPVLIKSLTV
jgi:hypothetical protein